MSDFRNQQRYLQSLEQHGDNKIFLIRKYQTCMYLAFSQHVFLTEKSNRVFAVKNQILANHKITNKTKMSVYQSWESLKCQNASSHIWIIIFPKLGSSTSRAWGKQPRMGSRTQTLSPFPQILGFTFARLWTSSSELQRKNCKESSIAHTSSQRGISLQSGHPYMSNLHIYGIPLIYLEFYSL